jgi:phospholipase D1/2
MLFFNPLYLDLRERLGALRGDATSPMGGVRESLIQNTMRQQSMLTAGRNCWRLAEARRVAFLIDSADYFTAFAAAAEQAQESIFIIGWDVDSRVRLLPDGIRDQQSLELSAFLKALVSQHRGLHVYILEWDFAVIFALEREPLPMRMQRWRTHRRIQFRQDSAHPAGASHHQKIVVVDDAIAFVGGIDLSTNRWDTSEHRAQDSRRVDPAGRLYPPVHDVQAAVDGEAAAALGYLARERWRRATGRQLRPSQRRKSDIWPSHLTPDMEHVRVAIARTEPAYNGNPEVREVQALYLDAIAAAQHSIYIEAQYFTTAVIGDALAKRLTEASGPEIILVLPRKASGWLEQNTMDVLRARLLQQLRAADRYGRLHIYCPVVPDLDGICINVHSKVLVVDEQLVRVGSSNLANRSMGLDTECDLVIESAGVASIEQAIAHFRNRLVGEHLGISPQQVGARLEIKPSLMAVADELHDGERRLEPLDAEVPAWRDRLVPDGKILDPERPIMPEPLLEACTSDDDRPPGRYKLLRGVIVLLMLVGLGAAWQWTPLGRWLDVDMLAAWVTSLRGHPMAPIVVIGGYVIGGLVLVPVLVLITVTALAFGPLLGFVYSLLGCLMSATVTYGIGYFLGHDLIHSLAGARIGRLSRRLAQHGLIAILLVRVVPVAPFSVVNIVAGASHIRLRDYILGTCLGMLPGLILMTVFGDQLESVIRDPTAETFLVLIGLIVLIALVTIWLRRRFLNTDSLGTTKFTTGES